MACDLIAMPDLLSALFSAVAAGFAVGLIVGLTGVGGGSLMTPLLITVFRLPAPVAIGTDLWFAAVTKSGGAWAHWRHGHVDLRLVGRLLAGSVPAAVLTLAAMGYFGLGKGFATSMTLGLAIALLTTAVVVAFRPSWQRVGLALERWLPEAHKPALTVASGVLLGVLVSITSIGAGAIGATLLLLLYPRLDAKRIVGSDIAHAVPLTLVAGIGHTLLGHVDWWLLGQLLVGSLPGIYLGAQLTRRLPDGAVRALLCASLLMAGWKVAH